MAKNGEHERVKKRESSKYARVSGGKTVIKGALTGEKTVSLHAFRGGKTVKGTTKQSTKAHLMRENREHTDIKLQ